MTNLLIYGNEVKNEIKNVFEMSRDHLAASKSKITTKFKIQTKF